jgi:DNA repair exonuclease SbcCD ATPase subunit
VIGDKNKMATFTPVINQQLQTAKAKLRDIRYRIKRDNNNIANAQRKVVEMRDRYEYVALQIDFGDMPQSELAKAELDLKNAQSELEKVKTAVTGDDAIPYLLDKIEQYQLEEAATNLDELKPLYQTKLKQFNTALAKAAKLSKELEQLQADGGVHSLSWPGGWPELRTGRGESRLDDWRDKAKKHGLL